MENKLYVTLVQAENFLMISKIDYIPREGVNVFLGKNCVGKTDIIRLLKAAFKGCNADCIQHGKDKTSFMVRLNDGHEIRRNITEKSKRFQVKTPEGDYKASPQAYLDALLGDSDLSFDPIAFVLKESKEQKAMLLETFNIGKIEPQILEDVVDEEVLHMLEFSKDGLEVLKDAEKIVYTKRSDINKQAEQKKAQYQIEMQKVKDFNPDTFKGDRCISIEVNIKEKDKEFTEAQTIKRQAEGSKALIDRLNEKIRVAESEIRDMDIDEIEEIPLYEFQIADLKQQIQDLQAHLTITEELLKNAKDMVEKSKALRKEIENHKNTIEVLPHVQDIPDIEAIEKSLSEFKAELEENKWITDQHTIYEQAMRFKAEYEDLKGNSDNLTKVIEKLRKDLPEQIMKNQDIPFDLSFNGDEVIINGNSLSLMATSEQLFATLQIYKERNKNSKLKIICADRIESLDDESYKRFWDFCNLNGYQAFVTCVLVAHHEDPVLVEAGEVKG